MSTVQTQILQIVQGGESVDLTYQFHPHHRNDNPNKSQWTISTADEFLSFTLTMRQSWAVGNAAWGLHYASGVTDLLGIDSDRRTELFIAKFVCDTARPEWHGYPANHIRNADRPPIEVLNTWLQTSRLPVAKISKISQGKPCKP